MATVKLYLYDLPFGREANIRFTMSDLETQIQMGGTYFDSVNVPETHDSLKELDVTVDVRSFTYSYAVMEWKQQIGDQLEITHKSGWWVDTYAQISNKNPVLTVHLVRDPWPSVVDRDHKRFKGLFNALPEHKAPFLPLVIGNDTMTRVNSLDVPLPHLGSETKKSAYAWVQIVTSRPIKTNEVTVNWTGVYRYGMFTRLDENSIEGSTLTLAYKTRTSTRILTLSVGSIMSDIVKVLNAGNPNIGENDILDISISERCPQKTVTDHVDTDDRIGIVTGANDTLQEPSYITYGNQNIGFYEAYQFASWQFKQSVTVNVSDLVRSSGAMQIRDAVDNLIGNIPVNLGSITFDVAVKGDIAGLTTFIWNDDLGLFYKMPEGHIPFIGNAWTEYAAKNRDYDRECMQLNIDKANADAAMNVGTGIASGVLTGALTVNPAVGVATAGLSIASTLFGRKVSIDTEKSLQDAKEQSYMIASSNTYSLGYGAYYGWMAANKCARIEVLLPSNLGSSARLGEHVKYSGYPAIGEHIVSFSKGYYSGFVTSVYNRSVQGNAETLTITGVAKHLIDLINLDLNAGIRIIETKEDI